MSPLSESACADILRAAVARAARPRCVLGAQVPQMGPPPEEQRAPEGKVAKLPQMGPQPPVRGPGQDALPRAAGDLTPAASSLKGSCGGSSSSEQQSPKAGDPGHKFAVEDTLFVFDWDDTVLPSTWIQRQGLRLDDSCEASPEQQLLLDQIAAAARKTLVAAKRLGKVVLVTNAERGWIELSCAKFLPSLADVLEDLKLVSARTSYETAEVSSPQDWKIFAFDHEIRRAFGDCAMEKARKKNVLSLGDSLHEREALLRATARMPNCRSKSLKFVERPDVVQLCEQHALVANCMDRIAHHDDNIDLCIRCP